MCSDIVLICGTTEEVGNFGIIAPSENPSIGTILREEIKRPKHTTFLNLVSLSRPRFVSPGEQLLDASIGCISRALRSRWGILAGPSFARVAL
jgi:hypothetical protein